MCLDPHVHESCWVPDSHKDHHLCNVLPYHDQLVMLTWVHHDMQGQKQQHSSYKCVCVSLASGICNARQAKRANFILNNKAPEPHFSTDPRAVKSVLVRFYQNPLTRLYRSALSTKSDLADQHHKSQNKLLRMTQLAFVMHQVEMAHTY